MPEAEEMDAFIKEFYADLKKITNHRTVYSWSVNIFYKRDGGKKNKTKDIVL